MATSSKELEKILKAVANKSRIEIIRYIRIRREATVGDIADEINLSFKGVSKNLRILYAAGILEREQSGSQVVYQISDTLSDTIRKTLSVL
jgi:DNA-binding transcriptional ArsR family regulator